MAVVEAVAATRRAASRSLVVGVTVSGVVIPPYGESGEFVLDLTDLQALAALTAGQADGERSPRAELAAALEDRGLLTTSADEPSVGDATPTTGTPLEAGPVDHELVLPVPTLLGCSGGTFDFVAHDGEILARLTPEELLGVAMFRVPRTAEQAFETYRDDTGDRGLDKRTFAGVVERAYQAGVLARFDPEDPVLAMRTRQAESLRDAFRRRMLVLQEFDRLEAERDLGSKRTDLTRVIAYNEIVHTPAASLAQILAAAIGADDGILTESYDFRPRLMWDRPRFDEAAKGPPAVILFSNYMWSVGPNLDLSARAKECNPHHVTIHGGPDTPKYEADTERFFAENPHVDVAVHGEGEATFVELLKALRGAIGDGPPDLSPLRDVPGLSFRDGDRVVRTDKRDRIADIDLLPSPVLMGIYEGFAANSQHATLVLETNRGCPYGCTFCDWGSATLSRIRKFDLERVHAELEWCAQHSWQCVSLADANFGIFERDVEIAEKIAELKSTYGWPRAVGLNYAKNTVKHLSRIIEIFTESGILAEGKMSMQSFDTETLATIRRKNIKVEKYHDLAGEFRRNDLPLAVDLMMGLPGSTPASFRRDVQACIDRNVKTIVHPTMLLANSPMNEPAYRAEHGIVAVPGDEVRESSTFTEDDWRQMDRLLWAYWVVENYGVLRQVAMYVRAESGIAEAEFYQSLADAAGADPERWPLTAVMLRVLPQMMVPPISWRLFIDEIKRYLVEVVGLTDDSALETVLAVQHALLPARDRAFPLDLDLAHDYAAWQRAVVETREAGHLTDWPTVVPPLRAHDPATFTVDDPLGSCQYFVGDSCFKLSMQGNNLWDLASPVARARRGA